MTAEFCRRAPIVLVGFFNQSGYWSRVFYVMITNLTWSEKVLFQMQLAIWSRVVLEKLIVTELDKNFPSFTGPKSLLPCSQQPAIHTKFEVLFITCCFLMLRSFQPHSILRLEGNPLSAVRGYLFFIFVATLNIWRPSHSSATWGCTAPWSHGTNITPPPPSICLYVFPYIKGLYIWIYSDTNSLLQKLIAGYFSHISLNVHHTENNLEVIYLHEDDIFLLCTRFLQYESFIRSF
jgi:hypothetical protein